jgi:hypothetical protein
MNARQRAVQVAAQVQRERAVADKTRGVTLTELGVRVKGDQVRSLPGWMRGRHLGSLAGACAGIMDVKPGSEAGYIAAGVIGLNSPRVGTIFVALADGTRHEKPLRMGTRAEMHKMDAAIARFNAMADAAS